MEVHAHTHASPGSARKKWTHYFWEFLMLFLAVFCGFLAENQREHFIENQREKVYIKSLIADIQLDLQELNKNLAFRAEVIGRIDSFFLFLKKTTGQNKLPRFIFLAGELPEQMTFFIMTAQFSN